MSDTDVLFLVECHDERYYGAPYDALFGYEPRVFETLEQAQAHADSLGESGDWGDDYPPEYTVEARTVYELIYAMNLRSQVPARYRDA